MLVGFSGVGRVLVGVSLDDGPGGKEVSPLPEQHQIAGRQLGVQEVHRGAERLAPGPALRVLPVLEQRQLQPGLKPLQKEPTVKKLSNKVG